MSPSSYQYLLEQITQLQQSNNAILNEMSAFKDMLIQLRNREDNTEIKLYKLSEAVMPSLNGGLSDNSRSVVSPQQMPQYQQNQQNQQISMVTYNPSMSPAQVSHSIGPVQNQQYQQQQGNTLYTGYCQFDFQSKVPWN